MKITYSSNNSGGSWWLKDEDWKRLEDGGWQVDWYKDQEDQLGIREGRFLGALASYAHKDFPTVDMAIAEWEHLTGQWAEDEGCNCCGQPHYFSEGD